LRSEDKDLKSEDKDKDLRLKDKDLMSENKDLWSEDKDKDLWSKDKDLWSVVKYKDLRSTHKYKDTGIQGLVNWSSKILEDKDFPRVLQHCQRSLTSLFAEKPQSNDLRVRTTTDEVDKNYTRR